MRNNTDDEWINTVLKNIEKKNKASKKQSFSLEVTFIIILSCAFLLIIGYFYCNISEETAELPLPSLPKFHGTDRATIKYTSDTVIILYQSKGADVKGGPYYKVIYINKPGNTGQLELPESKLINVEKHAKIIGISGLKRQYDLD